MKLSLIFVYNAESGIFNTVSDIAHKIFSPETYQCNLCKLTHGNFGVREEWKLYLESLDADCSFMHRDEMTRQFGEVAVDLPVVLVKNGDSVEMWLTAVEINRCSTTDELKQLISNKLTQSCQYMHQLD